MTPAPPPATATAPATAPAGLAVVEGAVAARRGEGAAVARRGDGAVVARRGGAVDGARPGDVVEGAAVGVLDAESRAWLERLRATRPVRSRAVAELYDRLCHEAAFHIRARATAPAFPRSDIDDLAMQAAGDALVAVLRKLDQYRGESRFWTWASRFAEIEAAVSVRRRLGRDRVGISKDPDRVADVIDPGRSTQDRAELREVLGAVAKVMTVGLTERQRTVLVAIAIDGRSAASVAAELGTTPGAVYKCLHDARLKLRAAAGR